MDKASSFLDAARSHNMVVSGATIRIKEANTKIVRQRNWAMNKAKELIQQSSLPGAESPESDMKVRTITVKGDVVFKQERCDLKGSFRGAYSHLSLP